MEPQKYCLSVKIEPLEYTVYTNLNQLQTVIILYQVQILPKEENELLKYFLKLKETNNYLNLGCYYSPYREAELKAA